MNLIQSNNMDIRLSEYQGEEYQIIRISGIRKILLPEPPYTGIHYLMVWYPDILNYCLGF